MITFHPHRFKLSEVAVKVDGTLSGHIKAKKIGNGEVLWHYKPLSGRSGEMFPTYKTCLESVRG